LSPVSSNTRNDFSHPIFEDLNPLWSYAILMANNHRRFERPHCLKLQYQPVQEDD